MKLKDLSLITLVLTIANLPACASLSAGLTQFGQGMSEMSTRNAASYNQNNGPITVTTDTHLTQNGELIPSQTQTCYRSGSSLNCN